VHKVSTLHKFAESRKKHNTIWDVEDLEGYIHSSQGDIGTAAFNFFKSLFSSKEIENILTQLHVIKEFSRFFIDE
jgi:hypothetical protein